MKVAKLLAKERIVYAIEKKPVDKIPVFPTLHHNSTRLLEIKIKDFAENEHIMAKCLLNAQRYYGYDGIEVGVDAVIEAEALGSKTIHPDNEPPSVIDFILKKKKDIKKIKKIANPLKDGRMPVVINATEIIKKKISNTLFITSIIMGPMNIASQLRGPENLIFDFIDSPDFANELLDFCLKQSIEYGKALIRAGADALDIGEAFCSLNIISPEIYRNFVLPRHKILIKELKEAGGYTDLHICGDNSKILIDMSETGASWFDIDWQVPMELATKYNTCRGNLDPSGVLLLGDNSLIQNECKKIINSSAKSNSLILGSGCEVSPNTPSENIVSMVEAARLFG